MTMNARVGLTLTQELHPDPSHSSVLAPGESVDLHMVSNVELFGAEQLVIPSDISWKLRVDAILVDGRPQPLGNAYCPGRAQACRSEDVFQPVGAHVYNENGIGCARVYDVGKTFVVRVTNRSDQAAALRAFVLGREARAMDREPESGEPIVVRATNPSDQPATVQGSFQTYDVESKGAPTAPGFTRPMGVFVSKGPGRALPALLTSQEERATLLQGLQRGRKGCMYQIDSDLLMRVLLDAQAAHSSVPVEGILSPRQQKGFRSLLLRIASWTNARFDQHLRAEIGDEDADAVLRFLGKLCVLPPECDPSGRLMGTKVPVLKPVSAAHEGAPAPVGSVGFLRARAPRERKDLAIEGLAPEAVDVGRAAYEAVSAASDEAFQELRSERQRQQKGVPVRTETENKVDLPHLPWNHDALRGWSIVGMNHYHRNDQRYLFVAMTKGGRCIKAENSDEILVFSRLIAQAQVPDALVAWELVTMLRYRLHDRNEGEPRVFVEMRKGDLKIEAVAASTDLVFQALILKAGALHEPPAKYEESEEM